MPDHDLTTPEGVKTLMESSTSESNWKSNCEKVKKANNGYPEFWYHVIVLSGLMARTVAKFK